MTYHSTTPTPNQRPSLPMPADLPIYDAHRLVGPEHTALIVLDDKTYTLRITRAGKLILTK